MLTGPGGRWVEQWQWQQKDIYPQSSWSSDADRGSDADCEAGSAECFYPFFDVSSRHIALLVSVCVCVSACVAVCLCQDITRFRFSFTTFCYYFVFCSTPVMYFFQFAGVFFCFMCKKKKSFYLAFLCPSVCMCACLLLLLFRALLLEFPFRARHFAAAFHSSCCYLPVQQTWP